MKIKEQSKLDNIIFPDDTKPAPVIEILPEGEQDTGKCMRIRQKEELGLDMAINDLAIMLDELPNDRFNYKRRREIEAHRKELVKAQQKEQRESIKISKMQREEEERKAKWIKKAIEVETATRIAEERQIESLARERRRRARRRRLDSIKDFTCKIILTAFIICGLSLMSNNTIRDRFVLTCNNFVDWVQSWTDGDGESSNKLVEDILKSFDEEPTT